LVRRECVSRSEPWNGSGDCVFGNVVTALLEETNRILHGLVKLFEETICHSLRRNEFSAARKIASSCKLEAVKMLEELMAL
jgi:hypothetical protein